jgi:hypothetical protein
LKVRNEEEVVDHLKEMYDFHRAEPDRFYMSLGNIAGLLMTMTDNKILSAEQQVACQGAALIVLEFANLMMETDTSADTAT